MIESNFKCNRCGKDCVAVFELDLPQIKSPGYSIPIAPLQSGGTRISHCRDGNAVDVVGAFVALYEIAQRGRLRVDPVITEDCSG